MGNSQMERSALPGFRPEFERALRLFGRASDAMKARGLPEPVLVGGAAVEIYSNSAIATGDFDIATAAQIQFEEELQRLGFVRPSGAGKATRGWIHPELPMGFEVVAETLLDGQAERDRVRRLDLDPDGEVAVIGIEDMIADRVGQYASGAAPEMLEQARLLYALHREADRAYMERRIRYESNGDYGVEDLEG